MGWGNFGARPNPPWTGSKLFISTLAASSRVRKLNAPRRRSPRSLPIDRSRSVISAAASTISGRRSSQARLTLSRTRGNPAIPRESVGGKYVPPKKGCRSGVRKTDIGQPPCPVIAWTAFM